MNHRLPLLVAAAALVVAVLGSTPVAGAVTGLVLPANSVGAAQLKPNAVTSAKINNGSVHAFDVAKGSLTSRHVRDRSLLAADFRPGQLPAGPKGDKGDPGATNVVYHREQAELSLGGIAQAVATCAPDETLVGGSAALLRAGDTISADPNVSIVASYPATAGITAATDGAAASRWVAIAHASEASSTRIVAFAACAKP
jgi:hypothetical protein